MVEAKERRARARAQDGARGNDQSNQKETVAQLLKGNRVLTVTIGKLELGAE